MNESSSSSAALTEQVRAFIGQWPEDTIGYAMREPAFAALDALAEALAQTEKQRDRAVYLGQHLHEMIDRDTWREQGAEWMGQYEGDHWAEQVSVELAALAAGRDGGQ